MKKLGGWIAPLLGSLAATILPQFLSTGFDVAKDKIAGSGFMKPDEDEELKKALAKYGSGGSFLLPLLTSFLGTMGINKLTGVVNEGLREKAGLKPSGSGLSQLGRGLKKKVDKPKSITGEGVVQDAMLNMASALGKKIVPQSYIDKIVKEGDGLYQLGSKGSGLYQFKIKKGTGMKKNPSGNQVKAYEGSDSLRLI
jgi:hypothetical protein